MVMWPNELFGPKCYNVVEKWATPTSFFSDNANNGAAEIYKEKYHRIHASNLCTEIMLPSNENWSFVCVLSSINVLHYDKWKNTDAVETMVYFLDAVITEFIEKLEAYRDSVNREDRQTFLFMERAYNFARENRALGLGALGWHSLLQSKMLAFNSQEAYDLNSEIFRTIKQHSYKASKNLAERFGEPHVLKGYGRRNATLNAIAPTTSSAFILGQVSQGIEPIWSNIYVKDIAKIKVTIKNQYLMELLDKKGQNTPEVWRSIRDRDGSVQHLEFLSEEEKAVFKTYSEIDQLDIVYQAANRQNHIDQGQSVNIIVHPDMPTKDINKIHITAWKLGLKSLYYQHSMNAAQKFKQKKRMCQLRGIDIFKGLGNLSDCKSRTRPPSPDGAFRRTYQHSSTNSQVVINSSSGSTRKATLLCRSFCPLLDSL